MKCPICKRVTCKSNGADSKMSRRELDAASEECVTALVDRWKAEGFSDDDIFMKLLTLRGDIGRVA